MGVLMKINAILGFFEQLSIDFRPKTPNYKKILLQ
jgi:hypothetical protein